MKAEDVALRYIAAPFHYRVEPDDLSCCDCFHPSDTGQRNLAQFTWDGITCSDATPCCAPSDDPVVTARCDERDVTSTYPGGFWANGVVCGNGIVDPAETCDDGNDTGGDGCSAECVLEGGATPTPTATVLGTHTGAPTPTPSPSPPPPSGTIPTPTVTARVDCAGDCHGDGAVGIDELILAVNIALGLQPLAQCPAADLDGGGSVSIDELLTAVNRSLGECA
jgi:cysteine-rich repeat protein